MDSDKQVWLVYEDDYGGTFSPYVLSKVCESEEEAFSHGVPFLRRVIQTGYAGTLDKSAYPQHNGGLS